MYDVSSGVQVDEHLVAYRALCTVLMQVADAEFAPKLRAAKAASSKYWLDVLNGDRLPRTRPSKNMTPREHFVWKLIAALLEIDRTVRLMENLVYYAAHAPRFRAGPSKIEFLSYQVEMHLHEVYILRERLFAFLKLVERSYRKDRSIRRITAATKRVRRAVIRALNPYVQMRGEHVHLARLRVPDIERLEFLWEMTQRAPRELRPKFNRALGDAYRKTKKTRVEDMRAMNKSCHELLNYTAAHLLEVFLRRNLTRFQFPPNLDKHINVQRPTIERSPAKPNLQPVPVARGR